MKKDKRNIAIFFIIAVVIATTSYFLFSNGTTSKLFGGLNKLKATVNSVGEQKDYPIITSVVNSSNELVTNDSVIINIEAKGEYKITNFLYSYDKENWYSDFDEVNLGKLATARKVFDKDMDKTIYIRVMNEYGYKSYWYETRVHIDTKLPTIKYELGTLFISDNYLVNKIQYSNDALIWDDSDMDDTTSYKTNALNYKYARAVDTAGNISKAITLSN